MATIRVRVPVAERQQSIYARAPTLKRKGTNVQPNYPPQGPPQGYAQPGQQYPPQPAPGYPPAPSYPPAQQYPAPGQQFGQPTPPAVPAGAMQFSKPVQAPAGDRANAGTLVNKLLIVVPVQVKTAFFAPRPEVKNPDDTTKEAAKGPADAVEVNLVDLDDRDAFGQPGKTYIGVMWGNKVLLAGLARQIGEPVLARMGHGVARAGNAAPLVLNDASEDPGAVQRANEFAARRPNWQLEPSADNAPVAQAAAQPAQQQYAPPAPVQQYAQPPMPGMGVPVGNPYAQPAQQPYAQPGQPVYAPAPQPGPYGPPAQPGYPGQPAPGYQAGVADPNSPEAQAAAAQMYAQQNPAGYAPQPGYQQ